MEEGGDASLEARPGVLLVGAPGVGKRTILSRLIGTELPDTSDLSSGGKLTPSTTLLIFPFGQHILRKGFLSARSLIWTSWLLSLWSSI